MSRWAHGKAGGWQTHWQAGTHAGQRSQAGTQVGRRWQLRLADRGGLEDSDCQPGISGRPQPIFNLKLDQVHCPIQSTCPGTQAGRDGRRLAAEPASIHGISTFNLNLNFNLKFRCKLA